MKSHENNEDYEITDTQALLAPARIRGFTLTEKLWAFFLVDNVCEVQWSENAFDDLELEYSVKKTVQSLVKNHYQGKRETNLISRKGKGLVILLYGPTGTGKTFTAGMLTLFNPSTLNPWARPDSHSRKCCRGCPPTPVLCGRW